MATFSALYCASATASSSSLLRAASCMSVRTSLRLSCMRLSTSPSPSPVFPHLRYPSLAMPCPRSVGILCPSSLSVFSKSPLPVLAPFSLLTASLCWTNLDSMSGTGMCVPRLTSTIASTPCNARLHLFNRLLRDRFRMMSRMHAWSVTIRTLRPQQCEWKVSNAHFTPANSRSLGDHPRCAFVNVVEAQKQGRSSPSGCRCASTAPIPMLELSVSITTSPPSGSNGVSIASEHMRLLSDCQADSCSGDHCQGTPFRVSSCSLLSICAAPGMHFR